MALVVGALVGTFIGIGIGIGNAVRKRMGRWSPCYLCLFGRALGAIGPHPGCCGACFAVGAVRAPAGSPARRLRQS